MSTPQGQNTKKVPVRKCLGCGEQFPKKDLIRIVRAPDGTVSYDLTGKKSGRGAYLCRNAKCLAKARKAGRIGRSLECGIPETLLDELAEILSAEE